MGFDLIAYDKLEKYITEAIEKVIKEKGYKKASELPNRVRAAQAGFLLEIVRILSSIKEKNEKIDSFKSRIYTASSYYVWDQICNNSGASGSKTREALDQNIKFSTNKLNNDEKYVLYTELVSFLSSQLYVDSNPFKGRLINNSIEYSFDKELKDLSSIVLKMFLDKVDELTPQPVEIESSYLSIFGKWSRSSDTGKNKQVDSVGVLGKK